MRVLIATDTYPPDISGSSLFTERLATSLAADDVDVHVVCASDAGPRTDTTRAGVTLHRLRSLPLPTHPVVRFVPPPGTRRALRRLVDAVRPDLLHAQDHFTIGRAAIAAARAAGIPVVATNHFMPENLLPYVPSAVHAPLARALWWDFRRVYARTDYVTTPTPAAAALLARQGFRRTVEPVSCGVDTDRFRPHREPGGAARARLGVPDLPTIGFVGRLAAEKQIDVLIRALAVVAARRPAQLLVVGRGKRRGELEQLAADLGVAGLVHFLGYLPDDRLPTCYAAADVFCMPSVAELQSIATLEALASGLPVVVADALALPHLVSPGQNGYLFSPGDAAGLADRLDRILAAEPTRVRMGRASRSLAVAHAQRQTVGRFEAIYRAVVARPADAGEPARQAAAVAGSLPGRRPGRQRWGLVPAGVHLVRSWMLTPAHRHR